jgi:tRNA threonylcarbamoyl adenosine modification protein (Sua5/YciO/YrdC/YwlC family)
MILKPTEENITGAADEILSGGVVAFPAGTVFGLGGLAPGAAPKIRALKRRGDSKRFVLNVARAADIGKIARLDALEKKLIRAFMPGELTLVLRAMDSAFYDDGFVRVRIPKNRAALALLGRIGRPLISTSANISGEPPALTAAEAREIFPNLTVLDSGEPLSGTPSTIARVENGKIEILRQGKITLEELLSAMPA